MFEEPAITKQERYTHPHKTNLFFSTAGQRKHVSLGEDSHVKYNSFFQLFLPHWLLCAAGNLPLIPFACHKVLTSPCSSSSCHLQAKQLAVPWWDTCSVWAPQVTPGGNCLLVFSSKQFSLLSAHFKKLLKRFGYGQLPDTHLAAVSLPPQWHGHRK